VARSRNIKPAFFKNESLVELPFEHRLLFVGLWTLADREGRLEDRSKRIKMELFPADNVDVEQGLTLLEQNGFIQRYAIDDLAIIQVVNFAKHQTPHHTERHSSLPDVNGEITVKPPKQDGGNPPDSLIPDSPNHEPGIMNPEEGAADAAPTKRTLQILRTYLAECKLAGRKPIPENHGVIAYAEQAGIPQEFLGLAWHEFKLRYTTAPDDQKKYRDWPGVFLKAVKGNWMKVWLLDGGVYKLTTVGQQAELARKSHVQH
jgi:hypothetical protein